MAKTSKPSITDLKKEIARLTRDSKGKANPQDSLMEATNALVVALEAQLRQFKQKHSKATRTIENHRKWMATTVHDLKAPITISLLNLELVEMEDDPEMFSFYMTGVRRELEFMLETIRNLLHLEKSTENSGDFIFDSLDISELGSAVIGRMAVLIKDKPELVIRNEIPSDFPRVLGDSNSLTRVLNNLFANSIKYTETGHITFNGTVSGNPPVAKLSISDTGSGIDEEQLGRLFVLYNADHSNPESTGIGLAFVKQVVDAHGGSVTIESKRHEGTTVHLELPIATD